MSSVENPIPSTAPAGQDDKVRKDLVQVFFGLVLGQIAVYVACLIEVWNPQSLSYVAAWTHIILAFALTTSSWFGWQISVRKARLTDEASVFQVGFLLSILDIVLVTLYFLLVHQVEIEGVAAFPLKTKPTITEPSAMSEVWIILTIFVIYALWDSLRWRYKEVGYRPWPSAACIILSAACLFPVYAFAPNQPIAAVFADLYLIALVFLFRAMKRLQKWAAHRTNNETTLWHLLCHLRGAPKDIKGWVYGLSAACAITYLLAIVSAMR